jgi:hypothetical protein
MQSGNKKFMQTIFKVSIQPAVGYLVNCHCTCLFIPIEFSTLGNANYRVTYTNYLSFWGTCITVSMSQSYIEDHWIVGNVLKLGHEWSIQIQFQFCAQLMIYHTVRVNTAYPHKNNLCRGRISVCAEGITSLVLYILCAIDLIHPYNIWFSC